MQIKKFSMSKDKLTLSQLEQYLSKAAWILKGPVDVLLLNFMRYTFRINNCK